MPTFFVDDCGIPVVSPNGSLMVISGTREIKQRINNALNTQLGSEALMLDYGLDIMSIVMSTSYLNNSIVVRTAIIDALAPNKIYGMQSLDKINCYVTGTTAYVTLNCIFKNYGNYTDTINIEGVPAQ